MSASDIAASTTPKSPAPIIPKGLRWMSINGRAFRALVDDISARRFREYEDTPAYKTLVQNVAARIIAKIEEIDPDIVTSALKSPVITDHFSNADLERIIDRNDIYIDPQQLMQVPEIASTRQDNIYRPGSVVLKDINGVTYQDFRLLGELPSGGGFSDTNILNRIDWIRRYDFMGNRQRTRWTRAEPGSNWVRLVGVLLAVATILFYYPTAMESLKAGYSWPAIAIEFLVRSAPWIVAWPLTMSAMFIFFGFTIAAWATLIFKGRLVPRFLQFSDTASQTYVLVFLLMYTALWLWLFNHPPAR